MEIQALTYPQAYRPHDGLRPDATTDRPRHFDRPIDRPDSRPEVRPEDIAKRLRHLVRDTRQDVRELREDLGDLKARAERLRALHQEAVETGDRKLHRLVTHLTDHLKADLGEFHGEAQEVRERVAFTKTLLERFRAHKEGEEGSDPLETEALPVGEVLDLSA